MKFKKFTWNWFSFLIGYHYGRNPVNQQRFLHIGLGPFLGIDFHWPEDTEPRPLGVALNDAKPGEPLRVQMYTSGVLGHSSGVPPLAPDEAESVWQQMISDSTGSMFRAGELPSDITIHDLAGLLSAEPQYGVSHEKADWIAQRVLGNVDPMPGESPDEFDKRTRRAEARFRVKYPNWRG